ncbi:sensor histidine kinase [Streptomyces sp. NPDC018031]|uniref:sensor histidine kinase n=1 Tax=Streptomyces sp. NPDC018031 TaxID=3365033 RepID=UPI0037AA0B27
MTRHTVRARFADVGFFLFAVTFSVLTAEEALAGREMSENAFFVDQLIGVAACTALFVRRRWPVPLAVVLLPAGSFSHFVTGAAMVAVFTVAAHRPPATTRWVAVVAVSPLPLFLIRRPDPGLPATVSAIVYAALITGSFGWGLYLRSRRGLIAELRDRAERAEAEAQRQVREEIAREMHDVLAHRLSLLSVHAGALEYHPGAPPAEIQRAAEVIRLSAHQALEDLREVIGVLRPAGGVGAPERPQPTLDELPRLVAESRGAGMRVGLDVRVGGTAGAPGAVGRTAYRIVQEGLTNARKHAPDERVTVTVSGAAGEGLAVEVRNAAPRGPSEPAGRPGGGIPGAGQGLAGLAERVKLAGGRLEHGRTGGGDFRLSAWLPWTPRPEQPDAVVMSGRVPPRAPGAGPAPEGGAEPGRALRADRPAD